MPYRVFANPKNQKILIGYSFYLVILQSFYLVILQPVFSFSERFLYYQIERVKCMRFLRVKVKQLFKKNFQKRLCDWRYFVRTLTFLTLCFPTFRAFYLEIGQKFLYHFGLICYNLMSVFFSIFFTNLL